MPAPASPQIEIIEKHPRAIRWMHWVNFPLLLLMIWSGLLIYWANSIYLPIPVFLTKLLDVEARLAEGMGWHFFLAWFFAINGFTYVSYLAISGEWRTLWPGKGALKNAVLVTLHDLHLIKSEPPHTGKFNAAQRIAYTSVILIGAGMLVTGLVIYKPVQLHYLTFLVGGYEAARLEHFVFTLALIAFFFIHVTQVVKAGWNNFRAMVTGYEIKKK
jgi:thiosulfate reductase cytochrome b subunit